LTGFIPSEADGCKGIAFTFLVVAFHDQKIKVEHDYRQAPSNQTSNQLLVVGIPKRTYRTLSALSRFNIFVIGLSTL
jgi:hypothetical protein